MEPTHKFIETAIFNGKSFEEFGINSLNACLYGRKESEIIEVECSIADNQEKPPAPQNDPNVKEADYWGWWDNEEQKFTLIWGKYFLLNMCFPYGMKPEEERSKGKAYRLNVKQK